ncbi:MAG TPA: hypothetical protein VF719_06995, partial [Abditibacteriaceae bacterium]
MENLSVGPRRKQAQTELKKHRRAAYVQPRILLSLMALLLGITTWWAVAQSTGTGTVDNRPAPFQLKDLPRLMTEYGKKRAQQPNLANHAGGNATTLGTRGTTDATVSNIGTKRFALTEIDITPNTSRDEREPAFSPGGDFIAFVSDRSSTTYPNTNGKYHVWIMNRNGSNPRQVTGLTATD